MIPRKSNLFFRVAPPFAPFIWLAVVGLLIAFTLNVFGVLYLRQPESDFFVARWWPTWFPFYALWVSFAAVAAARRRRR